MQRSVLSCFVISTIVCVTSSDFYAQNDVDIDANELSFYIQQEQLEQNIEQSLSTRPAGCPAGFVYLRSVNGCYKVVTDFLSWGVAGLRCIKLNSNAHLLIVNDAEEQRAVVDELVKWYGVCSFGLWTAGQRLNPATPDQFVWKIVNPVDYPSARVEEMTYSHWMSGQPNYHGGIESCMHLWRDQQFAWNDFHCWGELCSVCEIDM